VYVATPENIHWLGDDPVEEIAQQIVSCRGPSGHKLSQAARVHSG